MTFVALDYNFSRHSELSQSLASVNHPSMTLTGEIFNCIITKLYQDSVFSYSETEEMLYLECENKRSIKGATNKFKKNSYCITCTFLSSVLI